MEKSPSMISYTRCFYSYIWLFLLQYPRSFTPEVVSFLRIPKVFYHNFSSGSCCPPVDRTFWGSGLPDLPSEEVPFSLGHLIGHPINTFFFFFLPKLYSRYQENPSSTYQLLSMCFLHSFYFLLWSFLFYNLLQLAYEKMMNRTIICYNVPVSFHLTLQLNWGSTVNWVTFLVLSFEPSHTIIVSRFKRNKTYHHSVYQRFLFNYLQSYMCHEFISLHLSYQFSPKERVPL